MRYVALHYSADPEKDQAWAARERSETPHRDWERQMELREDVYDGQPVYEDYIDSVHWPARFYDTGLPIVDGSEYIGCWDCGQTLIPAFVLLQVRPSFQVDALLEVVSFGNDPMETFAPKVAHALMELVPDRMRDIEHVGDATVVTRSGSNGASAQEVGRKHGFDIRPMPNAWAGRVSAVTWLLTGRLDGGEPRFLVDGWRCPTLRAGFQGAYKFEDSPRGSQSSGPARILQMPLKNGYSHVHDALQYGAIRVRETLQPRQRRVGRATRKGGWV